MFGAHLPELFIILIGALIIFGPKRLPEIGSSMGQAIRGFKKHVSEFDVTAPAEERQVSLQPVPEQQTSAHPVTESAVTAAR